MNDAASDNGAEPAAAGDGAAPRISLGAGSEAGARSALGKGRALVPVPQPAARADFIGGLGRSHGVVAAGVAVVMGIGFVAGTAAFASKPQTTVLAQQAASQPAPPLVAQAATSVPAPVDATMDALMRVQGEVRALRASLDGLRAAADDGRQADAVRGLRRSVEALKQDLEGVRTASAASAGAVGQLGAKIDRLDRDPGPKLNEIAARLDKIDREAEARAEAKAQDAKAQDVKALDGKGVDARLAQATQAAAQLAARLDRVERQVASADATGAIPSGGTATAQAAAAAPSAASPARAPLPPQRAPQAAASSAPAPAPSPTGAIPPARPDVARSEAGRGEAGRAEPRPEPKGPEVVARAEAPPRPQDAPARPATVDGWLLRDVYGGVALVEGRAGGLREVAPGEYVPGVGEIRSIERRGRGWVVVTSRGLIQADNRW